MKMDRRYLLLGTSVPLLVLTQGKWVKPTIDLVVLPAHAQTSGFEASITASINFGESLGVVFSETETCAVELSTTSVDISNANLTIEIGISNIKGLVANVRITSDFSNNIIDQGFLPESNGGGGIQTFNYGEFPLDSCQGYDVVLDLRYLESESRLIALIKLIPK